MAPQSAVSKGPCPPERGSNHRHMPPIPPTSPSDEIDLIPNPAPKACTERPQQASSKLQSKPANNNPTLVNNMPPPPRRFQLETREEENIFKSAPAPRHAPGHFTNRKIVPRIDGPETLKEPSNQPSSTVSKKQKPKPAVHQVAAQPEPDTTPNRPTGPPPLRSPPAPATRVADETEEQRASPEKASFPFAHDRQQATVNVESQASGDTAHPAPLSDAQAVKAGHATASTSPSAQPPPVEDEPMTDSNFETSELPPLDQPQSVFDAPVLPVVKISATAHPTLDAIMERDEPQGIVRDQGTSAGSVSLTPPSGSALMPPPQSNRQTHPELWMKDARAPGSKQTRQHSHKTQHKRASEHRSRASSLSTSSSGATGITRTTNKSKHALEIFKDTELPLIAYKVNDLWKLCNNKVKDAEAEAQYKVEKYRQKLHGQSLKAAEYLETLTVQAQALQFLENEKGRMRDENRNLEQQMRAGVATITKLEDKCQTLKNKLDSTLKEQQDQREEYSLFKQRCQHEIDEVRADKKHEQMAREHVEQQLAAVREQLQQRVREVELHSQDELRHMNEKLQILSHQVDQKDAQIAREREMADQQSRQLEDSLQLQSSLDDMRAQTGAVLKTLIEQQSDDSLEKIKLEQEEATARLDNMTEHLEGLHGLLEPQSEAACSLSTKQEEGVSRILSAMETMSKTQTGSEESVHQLGKELRAHIDDMKQIRNREDVLEQQLEETRRENATLVQVIQQSDQERRSLELQLHRVNDASAAQEGRVQDLTLQVEDLKSNPEVDVAASLRCEALEMKVDSLKADLAAKCSKVSELEGQLIAKAESFDVKVDDFNKTVASLSRQIKDGNEASKSVATVKEECRLEIQRHEEVMEGRLQHAEKDRQQAENDRQLAIDQLEDARRELAAKEEKCREGSDSVSALQASLNEANLRIRELEEDATRVDWVSQARQQEKSATIESLRSELAASKQAVADQRKLSEDERDGFANINGWIDNQAKTYGLDGNELHVDFEADGTGLGQKLISCLDILLPRILSRQSYRGAVPPADIPAPQPSVPRGFLPQAVRDVSGHLPTGPTVRGPDMGEMDGGSRDPLPGFDLPPMSNQNSVFRQDLTRRVTVHSPYPNALTPVPLSVEEERSRRRGNQEPPKPAMRRLTRSATTARLAQALSDSLGPASSDYGPRRPQQLELQEDAAVKEEENESQTANDGGGPLPATQTQRPGSATGSSGTKIRLVNSKRPRHEPAPALGGPYMSSNRPRTYNDPVEDDEEDLPPRSKRARTQKPKAPAEPSRRGKRTPAQPKPQGTGLAAPGVVHGRLPRGVVHGSHIPPSSQPRAT